MLSCSNMQPLSQQVCCTHVDLFFLSLGGLHARQLLLTEGFIKLLALLEVKSAQIFTCYFQQSTRIEAELFQRAFRLLFMFIASMIIVHSLTLFSLLEIGCVLAFICQCSPRR